MVELVDTLASGASARKGVEVRVFFRAPKKISLRRDFFYALNSALVPSAVRLNKHFSLLSSESSV